MSSTDVLLSSRVMSSPPYVAPAWLPGGHLQTLYAALLAPHPRVSYRRERWETPDGDFVDADWLVHPSAVSRQRSGATASAESDRGSHVRPSAVSDQRSAVSTSGTRPLVVLFHGLEGCSTSHYAHALMAQVREVRWEGVVVHFRGCSGEPNRLPRAYHSGDSAEIEWMLRQVRTAHPAREIYAVGVSLGGNALLKWLGEQGDAAAQVIERAAAVSAPLDLMIAGDALGRGFNLVYTSAFLSSLRRKSLAKLAAHPDLYEAARVRSARTLRAFDNIVTAPLHGFRDTDDYWTRASSKPWLPRIAVPTLIVNARNDPFMPEEALPSESDVSSAVKLDFPREGGHVGFVSGRFPGHLDWLPRRVLEFFGYRDC